MGVNPFSPTGKRDFILKLDQGESGLNWVSRTNASFQVVWQEAYFTWLRVQKESQQWVQP